MGIDPGHNGRNYTDPGFIDRTIWNGREYEDCDTTGTETDGGYTEAQFNFNVAEYLAADLRAEGAKVVLTRTSNDGVGPCVTTRSQSIDRAHANVAIDIHADGGPPGGRGFAVLEPVADGINDHVIAASRVFGHDVIERFRAVIECGNMRNSTDAALLVRSTFQRSAAHALAEAIGGYLRAGA